MDVQKKLDEIVRTVAGARSMPMSASCVLNRAELLARLEEVRAALPSSLAQAQELIGGRDQLVAQAREEAERILASAHAQRGSLISDTEVARSSQEEADRILAEARLEAERIRAEADDYVDGKLANFEVVLTKTIASVDRGREKLLGRPDGTGPDGDDGLDDLPERSADPQTQRQRADAYADARLGAVSAVLGKTLEAVGRGRDKLLGARPTDELGAHMAAQDGLPGARPASDADFLAELAASQDPVTPPPAQPDYWQSPPAPTAPVYEPDPYAYQQGYAQQPDPYAVQGGYAQQTDPYAWPYDQSGGYGHQNGHQNGHQGSQQPHQAHEPQQAQQQPQLDETSLFDTSMIDLDQLRRFEQGR
ncbi:DivIVA domain-containing protein [Streptomyces sp. UNOC14_S4]|uniref:DivIVA domain-containing protein n=1 Tax=Streptomyces sp. UNOC14_S4 TaxID=2872340 RepID=UPI001E43A89A|nr:ATP synthase F0 subunit B [Streptomyces sp. UNOC14_S4]MCC3770599.1 cell division initiation protein [Streptomyces sp. UNOC14_S4]